MKIAHFIQSLDVTTGGPARSVTHLIKKIILNSSSQVSLISKQTLNPILKELDGENNLIYFFGKRSDFNIILNKLKSQEIDILHGHGIWQYASNKMSRFAQKNSIPYIITIRGMLEPWALKQKRIKKKIALLVYQKKNIRMATVIHATADMEAEHLRNLGFKNPIAIIPNGINIEQYPKDYPIKSTSPKKILFLSRIHKKKGIENLIEAWKLIDIVKKKNWIIEIVGNGDASYIQKLTKMITNYKLSDQILIKKPIYGIEKIKTYRDASLFILPTFSENFGVVIAEALASYTPVITTKGTPWKDLHDNNCGWWIEIGVKPLKIVLEDVLQKNNDVLKNMAINGRNLIEIKYSTDIVSKQMLQLYNWINNRKNNKPDFINCEY